MKAYPKITSFLGICILYAPLFLSAEVLMNKHLVPLRANPQVLENNLPFPQNGAPFEDEGKIPPFISKAPITPERALDILDFWFGFLPSPDIFPEDKMSIWFADSPEVDRQIRGNFFNDFQNALRGDYNSWRETPRGRLALILLLDQIPRHIYRNKPQEFMSDLMARSLVLEGMQKGDDDQLYPIEKAFFYLPLEHSENLGLQNLSVASYRRLLAEAPMDIKPEMQAFLRYAILHKQQIDRFGRFPHRNPILGRESTPEEVVFLNQWGRLSF